MPFLDREQLARLGFRSLGQNLLISDRASIHGANGIEIGDNVRIDDYAVLSGHMTIGRNVHVSVFCHVAGGSAGITFGDFSGLAPGCHVFTESDDYSGLALTNPTVSHTYRLLTSKPVDVGRHCIVGTGSLIFPGVTLGEGCAVGAMSKVTRSTEPWSIYAGIPARRIRDRMQTLLQHEHAYLAAERCRLAGTDGEAPDDTPSGCRS